MSGKIKKKTSSTPSKSISTSVTSTSIFSGPIPPPEIMRQYNQIIPGSAERILKMAEKEQDHRHEIEDRLIKSEILNTRLGLIFGFIIGITGIICGSIVIMHGNNVGGSVISATGISILVGLFIKRTKHTKDK